MQKDLRFKIISEGLKDGVTITCKKYNISRTIYYRWLKRFKAKGIDGLDDIHKNFIPINKTSFETEAALLNLIKEYPLYGPRALKYLFEELGHGISESAIYNIMKRNNLTKKEVRIKFAKKQKVRPISKIPYLDDINSGECWMFWVTNCGSYEDIGDVYAYTLYDLKSKISCTRLYSNLSFTNFEDILTAVAMPVARSLNLKINHLCFYSNCKLIKLLKKTFHSKLNKIISDNGFDFKIAILHNTHNEFDIIDNLISSYTENFISFIMTLIDEKISFSELKLRFQHYLRDYNMNYKFIATNEGYSPIDYHNKLTNTKLILPIWAYIERNY